MLARWTCRFVGVVRRRPVGPLLATGVALTVGAAAALASTITPTVTSTVRAGMANLACPPSGECIATGERYPHLMDIVPISRSGKARPFVNESAADDPMGTACPTSDFCMAIAQAVSPATSAWIIPIRDGVPRSPKVVSQSNLSSISCGSAASCWAFGANPRTSVGHAVHIMNGRVVHIYNVPRDYFSDGTCTSASSCLVLGTPGVISLDDGRVAGVSKVDASLLLTGVGCQSRAVCMVVGYRTTGLHRSAAGGVVATVSGGRIGAMDGVPGVQDVESIDCSPSVCFALGVTRDSRGGRQVIVPITNGSVGTPIEMNADSVVCSATGRCLATGGANRPSESNVLTFRFPTAARSCASERTICPLRRAGHHHLRWRASWVTARREESPDASIRRCAGRT